MATPYTRRVDIYKKWVDAMRGTISQEVVRADGFCSYVTKFLMEDVNAVIEYRRSSDPMTLATLHKRFPDDDPVALKRLLNEDRDFIYTKAGVRILVNRYLFAGEPIQCAMYRIARNMAKHRPYHTKLFYDLLSCGFIHVSSIVAASDHVDAPAIRPGEACRLMVAKDGYDHNLISQIEHINGLISLGVGVGFGVSNLPMVGKTERGKIRTSFMSIIERLNACNFVSLHERKPKVAIYLHVHNDTVDQALNIKMPSRVQKINNVFVGLMIPNYFMECVKYDRDWYLFPGDLKLNGVNLADLYGDAYVKHYKLCVDKELYTSVRKAKSLMYDILSSLEESGSPYIIWSDHLNEFNNQKAYGTLKTLNLCSEITNYSDSENDSSCTLLSCNMGMFADFPHVQRDLKNYLTREFDVYYDCAEFDYPELAKYAYMLGYFGTLMLNTFMGPDRERREIGLNPLGVYDMALMCDLNPARVCATISEALYRGAVTASCDEYEESQIMCKMYPESLFSHGITQFLLRGVTPQSDWTFLLERMKHGMANGMLTSQAPTATTSLLTGMTESVIIPISHVVSKESENGRNDSIFYGVIYRTMDDRATIGSLPLNNSVDDQLEMYKVSLPYIDHSQSVMLSIDMDSEKIFQALVKTYKAGFKTGVYYLVFKQINSTINVIRDTGCDQCTL